MNTLGRNYGAVLTAKFNGTGELIFTGGEDRVIRCWDSCDGELIVDFSGHFAAVRDVCFTGDDSKFCSCGDDMQVLYWDLLTVRPIRGFGCLDSHSEVNAVKFNEFASVIVSADSSVRLWDCRSHNTEPIQIFDTFKDSVTSLCLRRTEIIAGSVDGSVQKFDLRSNTRLSYNLGQPVKSMCMANNEDFILTSCLDSTLRLLLMDDMIIEPSQIFRGHTCKSFKVGCCIPSSNSHVVGGSEDGHIFIWDVLTASVVSDFRAHKSVVTSVSHHPKDDNCMITASVDGSVAVWKAAK